MAFRAIPPTEIVVVTVERDDGLTGRLVETVRRGAMVARHCTALLVNPVITGFTVFVCRTADRRQVLLT